ncbi:MAG: dockerin type I domain-containing protein, partial [Patescibacteria group bacterium]
VYNGNPQNAVCNGKYCWIWDIANKTWASDGQPLNLETVWSATNMKPVSGETPVEPTNTPIPTETPECTNGERDCGGQNQRPRLCQAGSWTLQSPCGADESCQEGNCLVGPTITTAPTEVEKCVQCTNGADRGTGDANCDGVVDPLDYSIWVKEYLGIGDISILRADFNCDGQVSGLDYNVLLRNISW